MNVTRGAFSLVEVVLAVAIFTTGVLVVAALILPTGRTISGLSEEAVAVRLAEGVRIELIRHRDAGCKGGDGRLDSLAAEIGPAGLRLVADRSATVIRREAMAVEPGGIAPRDRYYLVRVEPLTDGLAYRKEAGFLALSIRVQWPYLLPAGPDEQNAIEASPAMSRQLRVHVALTP